MKSKSILSSINSLNKNYFAGFLTLVFALIVGTGMQNHEMWRDELQFYMFRIQTGVFNPGDPCYLLYNALACLFLKLNSSLWTFQLYHLLVITAAVAVLTFLSPFSNIEKALISFCYYFVYEYGIIARYYGFFVLILFLIVSLLASKKKNDIAVACLLIILANHNPAMVLFAVTLSMYWILDLYERCIDGRTSVRSVSFISAALIFVTGTTLVILSSAIYLPALSKVLLYRGGTPPLFTAVNQIWNSYVPIPDFSEKVRFWWTNIINFPIAYPAGYHFGLNDFNLNYALSFLFSLFILAVIINKFKSNELVLGAFVANTFLCAAFLQQSMKAYPIRYIGILFLVFVYCYWLYRSAPKREIKIQLFKSLRDRIAPCKDKTNSFLDRSFYPTLYFILISQVFTAFYAYSKGLEYKFSLSEEAAQFIKWNNFQNSHVLVGYPDYAAQCISAHLKKPIFYPQIGDFGTYSNDHDKNNKYDLSFDDITSACTRFTEGKDEKVLLILNFPLSDGNGQVLRGPAMISKNSSITLVQAITGEVINPDEQFWLYELAKLP